MGPMWVVYGYAHMGTPIYDPYGFDTDKHIWAHPYRT